MTLPVFDKFSLAIPDKAVREKILSQLLALYRPKQRLKTEDKRLAKIILSLKRGYDGTLGRCELCGEEANADSALTLHHRGRNSINDNRIENLALLHLPCNIKVEHNPELLLRVSSPSCEREKVGSARVSGWSANPWSAREGEKADIMRDRWNAWIPTLFEVGGSMRVMDLAGKAVHALATPEEVTLGSSVTYRRYIIEDAASGIFRVYRDGGYLWAEYLGSDNRSSPSRIIKPPEVS